MDAGIRHRQHVSELQTTEQAVRRAAAPHNLSQSPAILIKILYIFISFYGETKVVLP